MIYHSESIKEIAGAMARFQARAIILGKDTQAYNYKYVTFDKMLSVILPELSALGLSVLQPLGNLNGEPSVHTVIMHESGEYIGAEFPLTKAGLKQVNDAQQMGAGISYICRYGFRALLCVGVGDDDDAACLTEKPPRPTGKKYKPEDPTPADSIIEGIKACTDIVELGKYVKKHGQTIKDSPRKADIEVEYHIHRGC